MSEDTTVTTEITSETAEITEAAVVTESTESTDAIVSSAQTVVDDSSTDPTSDTADAASGLTPGQEPSAELANKITNLDEIEQVLESVIFASTRPISTLRLKNLLTKYNYDVSLLGDVLSALEQKYEGRGFQLVKVAGGYQFRTHAKNADVLQNLLEDKPARLSQSALEVLAIVA